MLKQLTLGGAAIAAFASLGLATPAQAETPYPGGGTINVSNQSDNVIVCGNKAIGDITAAIINLSPVTNVNRQPVDCSIQANQR
jgi:hypothetical protein